MKKLHLPYCILLFVILPRCVKEIPTSDSPANDGISASTSAKPPAPAPAPPPTTILQWQKTYGSTLNELGYAITRSTDGNGYVFTASALGNAGDITGHHGGIGADVWLVKINSSSGGIDWKKCLGGTSGDYAYDIITTIDGGYAFAGVTQSNDGDAPGNHGGRDVWIVKLDASGAVSWKKILGGSGEEAANSIIQTSDGGFLIAGYTGSNNGDISGSNHGGSDAWIIKLSSSGEMVWQKTYGGTLGESASS